jgi:nucleoside 2-deoxyribosyltransferase
MERRAPRKPVIYIAGPFRSASAFVPGQQDAWGIHQHVTNAMAWALKVWRAGGVALCPHGNTFCFQNSAPDHVWLEGDLELLRRCDAVLLIPGWSQSAGATAERDFAVAQQLPVFEWRDLSHLVAFIAEWEPR